MDLLSEMADEEYGGGHDLQTTGFIVLGLLTFWIYTVWNFYKLISEHTSKRLAYFNKILTHYNNSLSEKEELITEISNQGFVINSLPRNLSIGLFVLSVLILLTIIPQQVLCSYDYISWKTYDILSILTVGMAVCIFCIADIYFLYWMSKTIKKHEYNELLFARLIEDPDKSSSSQPSSKFIKRWNNIQSKVVLFAVLSIPLIISPLFSIKYIHLSINTNSDVFLRTYFIWSFIVCISIAVFHLWGTKLLVNIYNDHLLIEKINYESLSKSSKWSPAISDSVIDAQNESKTISKEDSFIPKRSLAAILITDIVGFSRQMEVNEEHTYKKLLNHNKIIRKIIAKNYGKEIKTIGDAFLVRFNSAVDAVRSGIEIQNDLLLHNQNQKEISQIHVRIGIHVGDVLLMGNDIIGNGVNIAARIEPLSDPGGICISADVYNVVKNSIDIKVVKIGEKELKNIGDAPELYKIVVESIV